MGIKISKESKEIYSILYQFNEKHLTSEEAIYILERTKTLIANGTYKELFQDLLFNNKVIYND